MTTEQLAAMSPEEKRIRIAELCGWHREKYNPVFFSMVGGGTIHRSELPDYLNDLNACHGFEEALFGTENEDGYFGLLIEMCEDNQDSGRVAGCSWHRAIHATAAQRADAFLLTLG